jgi:hypothetical protein
VSESQRYQHITPPRQIDQPVDPHLTPTKKDFDI